MIRCLIAKFAIATALLLMSMSASAVVVNAVFTINNADLVDLFSTTLDNGNNSVLPNSACVAPADAQECAFFGGEPGATRSITITNDGYNLGASTGTLDVQYETNTGEITQVNSLFFPIQDLTIAILAPQAGFGTVPTIVTVVNGNGDGWNSGAGGPNANEQARVLGGLLGINATVDPDDNPPSLGQASIFQHTDGPTITDAPDFSTFDDIVDTCVGTACILIGLLDIDADHYRIDGIVNALGGDSLVLRAQTQSNNSIYTVNLTTAVIPVPAAVWLFGSALSLLGFLRRR